MRVVAKSAFKTYYGMVPVEVVEGEEFEGEFAGFLLDGGSAVEQVGEPAGQSPAGAGPADPDSATAADGTIDDVLAWVDGDADRAAVAREAEQGKDKPRTTLLKRLDEITGS